MWLGGTGEYNDPANWSSGDVPKAGDTVSLVAQVLPVSARSIHLSNVSLPAGLTIRVDGEPTPVFFNMSDAVINSSVIQTFIGRNGLTDLGGLNIDVSAAATFTNAGLLSASQGIGFGVINLTLEAGSQFNNTGTLSSTRQNTLTTPEVNIGGPGQFANNGLISVGGKLRFAFDKTMSNYGSLMVRDTGNAIVNIGTTYGQASTFTNYGTVEADGSATLAFNGLPAFETRYGQIVNAGLIEVNGGRISVDGDLTQTTGGHVSIDNGGTLVVDRGTSGGYIQINEGVLEFTGAGRSGIMPYGAGGFKSTILLTGPTAQLQFTTDVIAATVQAGLTVGTTDLLVSLPNTHQFLADLKLAGSYTSDEFSVSGNVINYAKPVSPAPIPPSIPVPTPTPIPTPVHFTIHDGTADTDSPDDGTTYTGPVAGLSHQFIDITSHSLAITALVPNSFIHTGSGDDAIDVSRTGGNNVLDGSTGSNFLVGGSGNDTFFVDDRGATADIWSTVVGFHAGDQVTVWGVTAADFALTWQNGLGASSATGLTGSFTKAGAARANVTLAGYTTADIGTRLAVTFGVTVDQPGAPGSSFMSIAGR